MSAEADRKSARLPISKAKAELSDVVARVIYTGERVVLTRHGKVVAGIVPVTDLTEAERDVA